MKSTGARCRRTSVAESRALGICRCIVHLRGRDRDAVDALREPKLQAQLDRSTGARVRARAVSGLASIRRRRLTRVWRQNPLLEGSTLELSESDERRVRDWLADRGLHLDRPLPETGRLATPRAIDRFRWAAVMALAGRSDETAVRARINRAILDDNRFWRRCETAAAAVLEAAE